MKNNKSLTLALAATTAICSANTAAGQAVPSAQSAPGGLTYTYGISSSLRINDNFGLDVGSSQETTTILDTTLSYGLLKETQIDTLQFDLSGIVRLGEVPGQSQNVDVDDPNAFFAYTRDGANSRLATDARIRRVDLNFDDPLRVQDQLNSNSLIIDDGTRTTSRLNFAWENGINDAVGYGFDLQYLDESFEDTTDPGLFDNDELRSEVFGTFRFTSTATGRLSYSRIDYEADDTLQEERETQELLFDLTYAVNPITDVSVRVGYADVEETDITPFTTEEDGLTGGLTVTRSLTNGFAAIGIDTGVAITGRRTNFDVTRSFLLKGGSFDATLGVTRGPSGDIDPIGQIGYNYTLANGSIGAAFVRDFRNDVQGNDIRSTRATLSYLTDINPVSSLDFRVGYGQVDDAGNGSVTDTDNTTFRATYIRALNADWNLSAGYEYRHRFEEGVGSAKSNEIFFSLDRFFVVQR